MGMSYVPLHLRSNHSLLVGGSSIPQLLHRAVSLKLPALGLTDENNLYGACLFFEEAAGCGVRPILGATLCPEEGNRLQGSGSVTLLVQNEAGYGNLCSLISRLHLQEDFSIQKSLPALQEGLFVLTQDPSLAEALKESLDEGRLYLEWVRPGWRLERERMLWRTAQRLGVGLVASGDVYFGSPGEEERTLALWAIREKTLLYRMRDKAPFVAPRFLRGSDEMARFYRAAPQALKNTLKIADACRFDPLKRPTVFPRVSEDREEVQLALREKTCAGAKERYGELADAVRDRLERELALIGRMGFSDYFLVVADIVNYAKKLQAPTAGRGSGASSVVSYCLGITNVDPMQYDLPFERFLNAERQDFPDLDIDFCWRIRDEVIQYVYRKYGHEHVAMVCTLISFRHRLAFREVARIHGISDEMITRVAATLSKGLPRERWDTLPVEPETMESILRLARSLQGFPHHVSVHCGGVVVTPDPMERHAPLQRAEKGVVILQYDKDAVERVGLVKLDLLGNRSLSTLREGMRWAGIEADPGTLPDEDLATLQLLRDGETLGCNQLESPSMRSLLKMLQPSGVKDVMKALALIRPGAASLGMKEAFVRRARGIDATDLSDPYLRKALGETHGIMLYEDDALMVAAHLAGLPLERADRFRRAVTKCRSDAERVRLSKEFLSLCEQRGMDMEVCKDLWVQMAKFNAYSFCRAHAASYAILAYALAYLKAHHPQGFWVSALNNNAGMYEKWVYVEEIKRMGIRLLPPSVNRSSLEFSLEKGCVRIGLLSIMGLSERTMHHILEEQGKEPFQGLWDFLTRVPARKDEVETLIRVGAFDFTKMTRPALLWNLYLGYEESKKRRGKELFQTRGPAFQAPSVEDFSSRQKARDEWRLLGMSTDKHPLSWSWGTLRRKGVLRSREMKEFAGERVWVAGIMAACKDTETLTGERMEFITLDDLDGLFEITIFPGQYSLLRRLFRGLGPYLVDGEVCEQYGALSLTAYTVKRYRGL